MSKYPSLTEADSAIMELLWQRGRMSSAEIVKQAGGRMGWTRQTVRTYLARLMDKGLVGAEELNKRDLVYFPVVSRREYAADRSGSIMSRYYSGLADMVAGIVQSEEISEEELSELERLIRRLRDEKEGQ